MFLADVFDPKIIYDQGRERDGAGGVLSEAWGTRELKVSVLRQSFFEEFVG